MISEFFYKYVKDQYYVDVKKEYFFKKKSKYSSHEFGVLFFKNWSNHEIDH